LTLLLLVILVLGLLPLPVLFIIASVIALSINYPSRQAQTDRILAHAPNILRVIVVTFSSGVFVGILDGTDMDLALARSVVDLLPPQAGPWLAPVASALSMPFSFVMTNTAYFFGVTPVISEAAAHFGTTPVEIARAALLDGGVHFLAPTVASTHLLVGLAGVDFAKHQRYTLPWTFVLWFVMLTGAMLTGAVPLRG
jgi:CitMHS family citrate-Mg2+:H+ or citrate-Ca2+:H+ symporter